MAYVFSTTGVRQTAVNAAAAITAAMVSAGLVSSTEDAIKQFGELRDATYEDLKPFVDADNEASAKANEGQKGSSGGGGYKGKSGGTGGGYKTPTLEEAMSTVIGRPGGNGKFDGLTIAQVWALDAAECATYGYGDESRPKTGRDYIKWMAGNEKGPYMAARAKVVIDNAKDGAE